MSGFRGAAWVAVGVLALAGWAATGMANAETTPSSAIVAARVEAPLPSPTPAPGTGAYLTWATTASFGDIRLALGGDDNVLGMGVSSCEMLAESSFGSTVQYMTTLTSRPTMAEAEELVRHAVTNLCPQHQSLVPGYPQA